MSPNERRALTRALETRFPMGARTSRLASLAFWDLYYGPLNGCDHCGAGRNADCTCETKWPGFSAATDELSAWVDENISGPLYYDSECDYLSDTEPQGEFLEPEEPETEGEWVEPPPYCVVERADIIRALFGKELASYVGAHR